MISRGKKGDTGKNPEPVPPHAPQMSSHGTPRTEPEYAWL
jgi:hypothetical protein